MKRHILIAVATAVVLTASVLGYSKFGLKAFSQVKKQSTSEHKSLRENAKIVGHHVVVVKPVGMPRYDDVQSLVRDSVAIVTGSVVRQSSHILDRNEKFIVTDFKVNVQEVLKGGISSGDALDLRVAGGQVQFEDGTSAEVKMPGYWKDPEEGKTYVFFLMMNGKSTSRFELLGGPQGLFEISRASKIQPQVRAEDTLMQRYKNTDLASFTQEVRQAVQQGN